MVKIKYKRNNSKVSKAPRRPFEQERLDSEMKLLGEYGLKCKREIWRVQLVLAKIRKAARVLLTLPEKHPKRLFDGQALLRRMQRYGLLSDDMMKLMIMYCSYPHVKSWTVAYKPKYINKVWQSPSTMRVF